MLAGQGPFRLQGRLQGRVTVSKSTATCLVMWRDLVLCGTAEGSLILHSSSQPQQQPQVMVLKPKRPVLKLVKAFANTCVLALCGGEVFCFELVNGLLTRRVVGELHAFAMPVVDICVNQRGPPDWGLCVITSDFRLHLFSSFSPSHLVEPLRELACPIDLGGNVQSCWYENVLCVGGSLAVVLIGDDDGEVPKRIPINLGESAALVILPLPEGRILISTGLLAVLVDLGGNPVLNQPVMAFSSPALQMICSGPYLVSVFADRRVDVAHCKSPGNVVQRLVLANAAPCLASANPYLFGELLYLLEQDGEMPCAFAIGLANQHSETLFRMAEPLALMDRLRESFVLEEGDDEDLPDLTQRALSLVGESFPPSCLDKIKELERFVYVLAGQRALRQGGREAWEYFQLADLRPAQLLDDEDDRTLAATPSDVLDYTAAWRASHKPDREVDTMFVRFLLRQGFSNELQALCLDATNRCDVDAVLAELDSKSPLAAAHLRSTQRLAGNERAVVQAYMTLQQPQHVCRVLLQTGGQHDLAQAVVPWMLAHCELDDLATVFKLYSEQLKVSHEQVLSSPVAQPRYLLALLGEFRECDAASSARQFTAALEEAVALGKDGKLQVLGDMLLGKVKHNQELAGACVELLQVSASKSALTRERIGCLLALGRHREALEIYVNELRDFAGAERYCLQQRYEEDAWVMLVRLLLETDLPRALEVLSRHGKRVNALEAVRSLPPSVAVHNLHSFLRQALEQSAHAARIARVDKNLGKSVHFKARVALLARQRRYVLLTATDRCSRCQQRFTQPFGFVRHPTGALWHVTCPQPNNNTS
ncbi:hypothetical protein BASA81_003350 [Batrachochytrium salamandrivorans]|nr:hypothetical protein BASA81_003951 [Batrachochytrium salamandrivorans]KAH9258301.1 hypothetical protein BASA81_003350 [Batrachochytrium salamandrivorans]